MSCGLVKGQGRTTVTRKGMTIKWPQFDNGVNTVWYKINFGATKVFILSVEDRVTYHSGVVSFKDRNVDL